MTSNDRLNALIKSILGNVKGTGGWMDITRFRAWILTLTGRRGAMRRTEISRAIPVVF